MAGRDGWFIISGPEFKRVAAELAKVGRRLPEELQNQIQESAEYLAKVASRKAEALPTPKNAGHTGLRRRVARGVHVLPSSTGARIGTSMPNPSEAIIPMGLDRAKGWRHPVFGNKNNWVRQPGYSWFRETISDGREAIARHLHDVLENAAQDIADAGD